MHDTDTVHANLGFADGMNTITVGSKMNDMPAEDSSGLGEVSSDDPPW